MNNVTTTTFEMPMDAMNKMEITTSKKQCKLFTTSVYYNGAVVTKNGKQCHYDYVNDVFVVEEF